MLDRLDHAFSSQREFIRDAGHELRTPITVIRGHLELLAAEEDPRERAETIAIVTDELDRMSRFVDDLLLLARAERPDFLEYETVDVEDLSRELLAKAQSLGPREWTLDTSGRGIIVADRQRLTQAVMNLADNAVHHTEDGEEIALGSAVNARYARFWVRDSGPGIDPEEREAIFERLSRGRRAHASYEGTGPRAGDRAGDRGGARRPGRADERTGIGGAVRRHSTCGLTTNRGAVMSRILIVEDEARLAELSGEGASRERLRDQGRAGRGVGEAARG